jgi:hypothetical protein
MINNKYRMTQKKTGNEIFDINKFMNGNEVEKINKHKDWEKIKGTYYSKYIGDINISYEITKDIIDEVKNNMDKLDENIKIAEKGNITFIRIIKASNGEKKMIFHTKSSLLYAIKNRLYHWLKGKPSDLIDTFGKIENIKFEILEIYKLNANSKMNIIFLNEIKKKYDEEPKQRNDNNKILINNNSKILINEQNNEIQKKNDGNISDLVSKVKDLENKLENEKLRHELKEQELINKLENEKLRHELKEQELINKLENEKLRHELKEQELINKLENEKLRHELEER